MHVYDYKLIFGKRDLSLIYMYIFACVLCTHVNLHIHSHPRKTNISVDNKNVAALNSALASSHLCCTVLLSYKYIWAFLSLFYISYTAHINLSRYVVSFQIIMSMSMHILIRFLVPLSSVSAAIIFSGCWSK